MADSRLEIVLAAKDITGRAFTSVQGRMSKLTRALFSFRGVLGGVIGAGGLGALITQSLNAADSIGKTADKVGVSVTALQELQFAASQTGVKTETLNMALQRFSRRLGEAAVGKGELRQVLEDYNIQLTDSNGRLRSNVAVLNDLADVIRGVADPQERLRIAFKAFDSEGAALVNTLKNGSDGLSQFAREAKELGLILDEGVIRRAETANDELDKLARVIKTRVTVAIVENSEAVIKATEAITKFIVEFSKLAGLRSVTRTFGEGLELVNQGLIDFEEFKAAGFFERQRLVDEARAQLAGGGEMVSERRRLGLPTETELAPTVAATETIKRNVKDTELSAKEFVKQLLAPTATQLELAEAGIIGPEVEENMRGFRSFAKEAAEDVGLSWESVGDRIAGGLGGAIEGAIKGFNDLGDIAISVLGDIASTIAEVAAQAATQAIVSSIFHGGGIVGQAAPKRSVSPWLYAGAPRLHSGLMPGEYPAILKRGEEVLTPQQSRQRRGGIVQQNNFYVSTATGDIAQESQNQIAARTGLQTSRALRQNG